MSCVGAYVYFEDEPGRRQVAEDAILYLYGIKVYYRSAESNDSDAGNLSDLLN